MAETYLWKKISGHIVYNILSNPSNRQTDRKDQTTHITSLAEVKILSQDLQRQQHNMQTLDTV